MTCHPHSAWWLLLALAGCPQPQRIEQPLPPSDSSPRGHVTPLASSSAAATVDTAAWDYVTDPRHWALLSQQQPPAHFVEFHREATTFEVGAFDEVRAYRLAFDRWAYPFFSGVDADAGCALRAVAADGCR